MTVALAILCIGGVAFLLRVLAALIKEWLHLPGRTMEVHFAKFDPSQRRGELVVMNLARRDNAGSGNGERIAL